MTANAQLALVHCICLALNVQALLQLLHLFCFAGACGQLVVQNAAKGCTTGSNGDMEDIALQNPQAS